MRGAVGWRFWRRGLSGGFRGDNRSKMEEEDDSRKEKVGYLRSKAFPQFPQHRIIPHFKLRHRCLADGTDTKSPVNIAHVEASQATSRSQPTTIRLTKIQ